MVAGSATLDATFQALAHPARRAMLGRLAKAECTVGELAAGFRVSFAASSKHVQVLARAGLVRTSVQGRNRVCTIRPEALEHVATWVEKCRAVWEANFRRLDVVLAELQAGPPSRSVRAKAP